MNIYVAGKTHDYERVRRLQNHLRRTGHVITHDWTEAVERHGPDHEREQPDDALMQAYASADLECGVGDADLVIAFMHPRVCGTLIEIGFALSRSTPVWIVGEPPHSIFWSHHLVRRFEDEMELPQALYFASLGFAIQKIMRAHPALRIQSGYRA